MFIGVSGFKPASRFTNMIKAKPPWETLYRSGIGLYGTWAWEWVIRDIGLRLGFWDIGSGLGCMDTSLGLRLVG